LNEPIFKFPAADCSSALYLGGGEGGLVVLDEFEGGVKILASFIAEAQLKGIETDIPDSLHFLSGGGVRRGWFL